MKIKGSYLILVGIAFFVLGKVLWYLFPMNLAIQSIATIAELSLWVFLVIGIIVLLRERREKNKNENK